MLAIKLFARYIPLLWPIRKIKKKWLHLLLKKVLIIFCLFSTCTLWDTTKCGETTHCLIYDTDAMRYYLAFFPAVFIFLAFLAALGIFYYSKGMTIYDESDSSTTETREDLELKEKGFKEVDLNA